MEKIRNLIIQKLKKAKKYKSSRVNELYQKYNEIYYEKKNIEEEQPIIEQISSALDTEINNYEKAPRFLFLLCASALMQLASIFEIIFCDSSHAIYIIPITMIGILIGLFYKKNRYLSDFLILLFIIIGFSSTMTRIFYFWGKPPHYYSRSIQFIFPCIYQVSFFEVNCMNGIHTANLLNLNWLVSFIMLVVAGILYFLERKNKLVLREEGINYGFMTILCSILFVGSIIESLSFLFPSQGVWVVLISMSVGVLGLIAICIASIFVKKIKLGSIVFSILLLGVWITSLSNFLIVNHPYYGNQNPFFGKCFVDCFSLMAYRMNGMDSIHYSIYLNFLVSLIMGVIFASKYSQVLSQKKG